MGLYENVKAIGREKGKSIAKIERDCDMPMSSIRKWNTNSPSIFRVLKVSEYLGVTLDELVNRRKEMSREYHLTAPEVFARAFAERAYGCGMSSKELFSSAGIVMDMINNGISDMEPVDNYTFPSQRESSSGEKKTSVCRFRNNAWRGIIENKNRNFK